MADNVAVPDVQGFSESLISEATKAWDEPETSTGDAPPSAESPVVTGAESSTTEEVSNQPVVADRGDGRDDKGRFAPKGEKPAEAPQDPGAKAPDATSPTQQPAEATPETPQGEVEAEGTAEPYSVRFGGRDFAIEGAVRTGSHIVIPATQEQTINRYIGMGLKYETERETIKRDKAQTAIEREMFAAETGPVMEEVKRLFEICGLQDENQFAEAFTAYAWELRNSLPMLKERMELSKQKQELEIQRRMSAPDPEQVVAGLANGAVETAKSHLTDWKTDPQTKGLVDSDWTWIQARVEKDPTYFLQRAGQRLTEAELEAGVQPGEVYFNQEKLVDLVNLRLEHRKDLANAIAAQKQAVAIAKENAVRKQAGSVPPPPASGGADAAPVPEVAAAKKFGSMDELKKDLGVGW